MQTDNIIISPSKTLSGEITIPASKSYAQRAIAIASLCKDKSILYGIDTSNDINAAFNVVGTMGSEVLKISESTYSVSGRTELASNIFDISESGLSARLFTPIAALYNTPITIKGEGSILKRPFDMMQAPLKNLSVDFKSNNNFLPITVCGGIKAGEITIDGSLSSQFLTGLLIALPLAENDSVINVNHLQSKPYIDITLQIIKDFGVDIINENYERFVIKGSQNYSARNYHIEGDWSSASCLIAAGIILDGEITLKNLNPRSVQADREILRVLDISNAAFSIKDDAIQLRKSNLKGFAFDATNCPDLFPALVAIAAAAQGESRIAGTWRLTHKESDRAKTLKDIYEKVGINIDLSYDNLMIISGGDIYGGVTIDSHNDHRIAMSGAVTALRADKNIEIKGKNAVNKSYPNFWKDLKTITK